jgi:hypothetical protein
MLGFIKCNADHAIYCQGGKGERLIVGVYVDDLIISGNNIKLIDKIKQEMAEVFKMSDLGLLTYYLGIEVKQTSDGIFLSQGSYGKKILEKGGLLGWNPCLVPMQPKLKLKESSMKKVDPTEYRSLVGSLRYLVNTRPDLAFSVGYANRYMEEPHEDHLAAVKQILRYIAGTSGVGGVISKEEGRQGRIDGV